MGGSSSQEGSLLYLKDSPRKDHSPGGGHWASRMQVMQACRYMLERTLRPTWPSARTSANSD